MAVIAGYKGQISVSGTPVSSAGEACANIDSGAWLKYQVTAAAHRILWVPSGLTVKKNGVTVDPTLYTVEALFGTITFLAALVSTDVITANVHYLPTTAIAAAKSYSRKVSCNLLDKTAFGTGGRKARLAGVRDAEITFDQVEPTNHYFIGTAISTPVGTRLDDMLDGGTIFVVEIQPDVTSPTVWRAFVLADSDESKSAVDAIAEGSFSMKASDMVDTLGNPMSDSAFGWGSST